MFNRWVSFIALICFQCTNDSFVITKVIDGNSIELSNGVIVSLDGVSEDNANTRLLERYVGVEVYLFDRNNDPIESPSPEEYLYLYDVDGENINLEFENIGRSDIKSELPSETPSLLLPNRQLSTLYKELKSAVILVHSFKGDSGFLGSGFFIDASGIAVSNYHVFEGTTKGKERIQTENGEIYQVSEVLSVSKEHDFIVFKVHNESGIRLPFLTISKKTPDIGDECFAIGNPRGFERTLSKGIISQIRNKGTLLQTTAEITHGSSGGPLFNMEGEVIGITSSGVGEGNLNFAININLIGFN